MKKSGFYILTASGKKGMTTNGAKIVNGKVQVELIDEKFCLTGEKILVDPKNIEIIGFWD